MSASLRLAGLGGVRGERVVFSGVDLALEAGDAAVVTGPNGVGKSSLLRLIAGLLQPAAGTVSANGAVALAGEDDALDETAPLARAIGFWARIDGNGHHEVAAALDALALGPLADVPVRMLSTGQKKRAVLARVLAGGAPIWLLDEPVNGLDTASRERLGSAIARHRDAGGIVVAATHQPIDMPGAETLTLGTAA